MPRIYKRSPDAKTVKLTVPLSPATSEALTECAVLFAEPRTTVARRLLEEGLRAEARRQRTQAKRAGEAA